MDVKEVIALLGQEISRIIVQLVLLLRSAYRSLRFKKKVILTFYSYESKILGLFTLTILVLSTKI